MSPDDDATVAHVEGSADLAKQGLLDILSSDYDPASLLQAAFTLAGLGEHCTLPQTVAMVFRTSAVAAGLEDRGEIRVGLRADLVHVRAQGALPVIQHVWRQGKRVY